MSTQATCFASDPDNTCVCCLTQDVPFVRLVTCSHDEFFGQINKFRTSTYPLRVVCQRCHVMLIKFMDFKEMVEYSIKQLNAASRSQTIKKPVIFLRAGPVEYAYAVDSQPMQVFIDGERMTQEVKKKNVQCQDASNGVRPGALRTLDPVIQLESEDINTACSEAMQKCRQAINREVDIQNSQIQDGSNNVVLADIQVESEDDDTAYSEAMQVCREAINQESGQIQDGSNNVVLADIQDEYEDDDTACSEAMQVCREAINREVDIESGQIQDGSNDAVTDIKVDADIDMPESSYPRGKKTILDLTQLLQTTQEGRHLERPDEPKGDALTKTLKLLELLESSFDGRAILKLHRKEGLLSNSSRRKICNIIIKELLGDDPKGKRIPSSTLYDMACQIKQIFNKENISTYLVPYTNNKKLKIKKCTKGKLFDCLQNRRREYRHAEKEIMKGAISSSSEENTTNMTAKERADISEDISWIKVSTEPWKLLKEKWKNTTKYRREEAEKMSISEYMVLYPGLKKPTGYHLLCIDFDNLHPEAADNLYKYFMLSKKAILKFASAKFKSNPEMNDVIKTIVDNLTEHKKQDPRKAEEVENISAFSILSLLVGPPLVKRKLLRPSKQECKDWFITHVVKPTELQETIRKRKAKYLSHGATLQPSIFIIGENLHNIIQYIVVVDNIFYNVTNIVQAVDVCFKMFHALHCQYPLACEKVWHFIQKGFYKITTPFDKEFVTVNSLLADLHLVENS